MTGTGVVLYLVLTMNNYNSCRLSCWAIFLFDCISFFVITWISKRHGLVRVEGMRTTRAGQDEDDKERCL